MAQPGKTNQRRDTHTMWPGGAVSKRPTGEAETEADRAEGNARISARRAARQDDQSSADPQEVQAAEEAEVEVETEQDREDMERAQQLKQQAAAEAHEAIARERGKGPHGRL